MRTGTGDGAAPLGARSAAGGRARSRARALAIALALLPAAALADGVRVRAEVDRAEVAADEVVHLTVRIESPRAPEAVEFPKGELPFEVVSRSQSNASSFSFGGGGGVSMGQTTTYQLALRPRGPGALVIPQVVARVGGLVYASDPITVKVLPAGSRPAPAPAAPPRRGSFGGWERDLILRVELDRQEVFVGEQVTASVWLLSPVGLVQQRSFTPPAFDGWWVERLEQPEQLQYVVRNVDGIPTRAYLLVKLALFPTRAGELAVGAFQADLLLRSGAESAFSPFLDDVKTARRASAPVKVRVKPLPAGAPAGFSAVNVGHLTLETKAADASAEAGQPLAIEVVATGEGNVRVLSLPRLPELAGARRFEPTVKERVAPRGDRFGGSRTVETLLVPERTGELVVPPLSWPVFDPRQGKYEVLQTAELRIPVRPGGGAAGGAGGNALAAGLRPIRTDAALRRAAPPPWRTPWFAALLAAPALGHAALALALGARERARTGAGRRRARDAAPAARRRLSAARRRLAKGDRPAFLAEVSRALEAYASDRLGRPAAGLTREALAAALADAGAHPPSVKLLLAALDGCDAARYGGGTGREQELLELAGRALAALEEADWAPAAARAGGRA